jgi:hypothetical protein
LVHDYPPARDKEAEEQTNWIDRNLAYEIGKLGPEHNHPGKPCDEAGCPNKPDWQQHDTDDAKEIRRLARDLRNRRAAMRIVDAEEGAKGWKPAAWIGLTKELSGDVSDEPFST